MRLHASMPPSSVQVQKPHLYASTVSSVPFGPSFEKYVSISEIPSNHRSSSTKFCFTLYKKFFETTAHSAYEQNGSSRSNTHRHLSVSAGTPYPPSFFICFILPFYAFICCFQGDYTHLFPHQTSKLQQTIRKTQKYFPASSIFSPAVILLSDHASFTSSQLCNRRLLHFILSNHPGLHEHAPHFLENFPVIHSTSRTACMKRTGKTCVKNSAAKCTPAALLIFH